MSLFDRNFEVKKDLDFDFFMNFQSKLFFSNGSKKFSRRRMHFIFSSESVFNLLVYPQKNSGRYNKTVRKYSKKNTTPPALGLGGGYALIM